MSISYGSKYLFKSAYAEGTSVSVLDSTHFVVAYYDGSDYGLVKIGVISSNNVITYGSEYTFATSTTKYISVAAIDSTHFVVAFRDESNNNYGTAVVGTVSNGDDVTFGSEYIFKDRATSYISVCGIDSTHFAIIYNSDNPPPTASSSKILIGTVSNDDEISFGSDYEFLGGSSSTYNSISKIDSTHFVAGCNSSSKGRSVVGTISNDDEISYGDVYIFNNAETKYISTSLLDSTHFVVSFMDDGGDDYGISMVGVISNVDEISFGSEYVFNSAITNYTSIIATDSTHFVVSFRDDGGDDYGIAIGGIVSNGNEIAYDSEYAFNSANSEYISSSYIGSNYFVVTYQDVGGDSYGESIIGLYTPLPLTKTVNGLDVASVKTFNDTAIASVKTINNLINV